MLMMIPIVGSGRPQADMATRRVHDRNHHDSHHKNAHYGLGVLLLRLPWLLAMVFP
jgi:hypothetical protein